MLFIITIVHITSKKYSCLVYHHGPLPTLLNRCFFLSLVLLLLSPPPAIFAERNHIPLWPLFSRLNHTKRCSPKSPTHLHVISLPLLKIISVFLNHRYKAWNGVSSVSCSSGGVKFAYVSSPKNVPITFSYSWVPLVIHNTSTFFSFIPFT